MVVTNHPVVIFGKKWLILVDVVEKEDIIEYNEAGVDDKYEEVVVVGED